MTPLEKVLISCRDRYSGRLARVVAAAEQPDPTRRSKYRLIELRGMAALYRDMLAVIDRHAAIHNHLDAGSGAGHIEAPGIAAEAMADAAAD